MFNLLIFVYNCREECKKQKCEYYFSVDSTVHFDNPDTLKLLIEQNRYFKFKTFVCNRMEKLTFFSFDRGILAPIMIRKDSTWSNVWGAVNQKGFYSRSDDYIDIITRNRL